MEILKNVYILPTNAQKITFNAWFRNYSKFDSITKIDQDSNCIIKIETIDSIYKISKLGKLTFTLKKV